MAADSEVPAIKLDPRAARTAGWKLITVPMSLPPVPTVGPATRLLRDLKGTRLTLC
jgi:hypothetical protein